MTFSEGMQIDTSTTTTSGGGGRGPGRGLAIGGGIGGIMSCIALFLGIDPGTARKVSNRSNPGRRGTGIRPEPMQDR